VVYKTIELYEKLKIMKKGTEVDKKELGKYANILVDNGSIEWKNGKLHRSDNPVEPFNNITKLHGVVQLALEKDIPFRSDSVLNITKVPYTTVIKYLRYLRKKGKIKRKNFIYYKLC